MTDETIKVDPNTFAELITLVKQIGEDVKDLSKRFDAFETSTNAQLEAIRSGLVTNYSDFSRLTSKVWSIGAELNDLGEEIRKDKLALK